jgi:hypothetical protein
MSHEQNLPPAYSVNFFWRARWTSRVVWRHDALMEEFKSLGNRGAIHDTIPLYRAHNRLGTA